MIRTSVIKDTFGIYRIYAQRYKHKWWFELGRHSETDRRLLKALRASSISWLPGVTELGLFDKKSIKNKERYLVI